MNKINCNFPILKVENVKKSYFYNEKEILIFKDLNIDFYESKTYAITGVSGSGKTTFLNLISGFDVIDEGKILFNNKIEINKLNEEELSFLRNVKFGYVFQSFYLLPELNVIENIVLPALKKGTPKRETYEKARFLMKEINIANIEKNFINSISGGEAQRVAIARSLINDPEIILADEPTGNLDVKNREGIVSLLFNVVRKFNKILILVTHDISIANMCDYKYKIENYNFVLF